MKHTFTALLISLGISTTAQAEVVEILIDEQYTPYTYSEGGAAKGAYVSVMKEADELMPNFELVFKPLPWKRALSDIETGLGFAILPPYATRDYMDYSTKIYGEKVVAVCNTDNVKTKPSSYPAEFKGLTFGNNSGFGSPGEAFFKEVESGHIALEETKTTERNLKKLLSGRLDCYVNDSLVISNALNTMLKDGDTTQNTVDKIKEYAVVNTSWVHIGLTQKGSYSYKNDFMKELNTALDTLRSNGEINKIVQSYK